MPIGSTFHVHVNTRAVSDNRGEMCCSKVQLQKHLDLDSFVNVLNQNAVKVRSAYLGEGESSFFHSHLS